MSKYLTVSLLTLQEYFIYRLNFILWRFRSFVLFLTVFFFWLAVYGDRSELLGYQKGQILAYLVGVAFLRGLIFGNRSGDLPGQIRSGELTRLIIKPIHLLPYWLSRDAVDKLLNVVFTTLEVALILLLFRFPLYFPSSAGTYLVFALMVLLAGALYYFFSFFLAATAFWTEEIWATRWLFGIVLLEFLAGAFFPIDLLPAWLVKVINYTPFPYMLYFPMKVWLEQLGSGEVLRALVLGSFWLLFFIVLTKKLLARGLRNYGAYGG